MHFLINVLVCWKQPHDSFELKKKKKKSFMPSKMNLNTAVTLRSCLRFSADETEYEYSGSEEEEEESSEQEGEPR